MKEKLQKEIEMFKRLIAKYEESPAQTNEYAKGFEDGCQQIYKFSLARLETILEAEQ